MLVHGQYPACRLEGILGNLSAGLSKVIVAITTGLIPVRFHRYVDTKVLDQAFLEVWIPLLPAPARPLPRIGENRKHQPIIKKQVRDQPLHVEMILHRKRSPTFYRHG